MVLVKTGPTNNNASAGATLNGVYGISLHELGYDIRKPGLAVDIRGSHCGAGAPRFNITLADGSSYFLGCNSPPATSQTPGTGWLRLRWGGAPLPLLAFNVGTGTLDDISGQTVKSISIVFDEAQDLSGGPDQFGAAILDNIDVNGALVGQGRTSLMRTTGTSATARTRITVTSADTAASRVRKRATCHSPIRARAWTFRWSTARAASPRAARA